MPDYSIANSKQPASPRSAANVARILWGLVFVASSIINLTVTLPRPELYRDFADLTFFPFYRALLLKVALPNGYLITGLVVVFELVVGVLILGQGRAVRLGLIGTALWVLFVCPAMGWYTIFSPLLLLVPGLLLRRKYDRSVLDLLLKRNATAEHSYR
jgi:hypothetical protein